MRLNIGCADIQPADWTNVDVDPQWGAEVLANPRYGLPWIAGVADGAVSAHCLQMVAWPDLVPWLSEVRRVLRPGAYLRLSVPDLPGAYAAAVAGDRDWFPIDAAIEPSVDGALCCYLTQCGATRSVFTGPWLVDLCLRAGFVSAVVAGCHRTAGPGWLTDLDDQPDRSGESIYVDARA